MSDALNHTLDEVCLRLERGLQLAEQELAETRDRCTRLELVIRSIRAQRSELSLLERRGSARELEPYPAEAMVQIPEAAADIAPAADAAQDEDDAPVTEIPTSYMPMLEELWDIARHSDPD